MPFIRFLHKSTTGNRSYIPCCIAFFLQCRDTYKAFKFFLIFQSNTLQKLCVNQHIIVIMLHDINNSLHSGSCNKRIFPCFKVYRNVITVKHLSNTGKELISRHSCLLLIFSLFLTLVCLRNISSQNIGNRFSCFIHADKHINFMPFFSIICEGSILKVSDKAICIDPCSERIQTCKCCILCYLLRIQIG